MALWQGQIEDTPGGVIPVGRRRGFSLDRTGRARVTAVLASETEDPLGTLGNPVRTSPVGTGDVQLVDGGGSPLGVEGNPLVVGGITLEGDVSIEGMSTEAKQDDLIAELEGKLEEATFTGRVGEVQASPTANTLLGRLKAIQDALAETLAVTGPLTDTQLRASAVPVSLASVPDHAVTNVGTFAVQENGSALAALQAIQTAIQILDDIVSGSEAQVDVVSSALPSGAATAANQSTIIGHVDGIETLLTGIDADTDAIKTAAQVIDDWDESDRAKVNPIVGQAGISAGAGNIAANTPRITLAADDPGVALLDVLKQGIARAPIFARVFRVDYSGDDPIYLGWAAPSTATSASSWAITKLTWSSGKLTLQQWAGGGVAYSYSWDNRASHSYS